jgi:LacI family transcriptional regulator
MTFRQATIHDVAKRAQVSVSTVSNVLTGNRPVSEETRERVLQIVEEIGYRPNRLARGLVSRSSKTIGVVASGLEYFGPSRTLVGIEQEASERGYTLILNLIHEPEMVDVEPVVANLLMHQVEGIVWAIPEIGRNRTWWHDAAERLPVPVVFLNHHGWLGSQCVDVDNRYGGYIATQHLLDGGYEHIGLIAGPEDWFAAKMRRTGWEEALHDAGRAGGAHQIAVGDWSPLSGEQALYALRRTYPEMEAIFVANDQMAIGVLRAASDLALRVPADLAIVGFDDIPEAAFTQPRLTTIRQPVVEMGRLSVARLIDIIADSAEVAANGHALLDILEPELIVRQSSRRIQ